MPDSDDETLRAIVVELLVASDAQFQVEGRRVLLVHSFRHLPVLAMWLHATELIADAAVSAICAEFHSYHKRTESRDIEMKTVEQRTLIHCWRVP